MSKPVLNFILFYSFTQVILARDKCPIVSWKIFSLLHKKVTRYDNEQRKIPTVLLVATLIFTDSKYSKYVVKWIW